MLRRSSLLTCLLSLGCGGVASSDAGLPFDGGLLPDSGTTPDASVDAGCLDGQWGLNDVSFLFPLPAPDAGGLLAVDPQLLPLAFARALPPLTRSTPNDLAEGTSIVAARVDPCFLDAANHCHKQIRLVAQPVGERGAVDATVHLFYELTDSEFDAVVGELRALKTLAAGKTSCAPLGVHPVMAQEGLDGPYARALSSLVRQHCGARNLTRIAVMTLAFGIPAWDFSAFDVADGGLSASPIPRLPPGTLEQQFIQTLPPPSFGRISPLPSPSAFPLLVTANQLRDAGVSDLDQALDESWRIENPLSERPVTIDCVSCHLAERARGIAQRERGVTAALSTQRYMNPRHRLEVPVDGFSLRSQRVFGYLARTPSISPRVANESAEVADRLARWP